jgi:4-diphosphocytidyl-2-C-methyl-D-erythritol kinase
MNRVTLNSFAKVNLYLDILSTRTDGYHLLEMVNAKISLHDEITCSLTGTPGIQLTITDRRIPTGPENTAWRAADLFFRTIQDDQGVEIEIQKRVPFGAGLGGGSANAAAVLKALNQIYNEVLSTQQLIDIGAKIGADVPFFIVEGCCHVRGIGEIIEPVNRNSEKDDPVYLVLCSPEVEVSTGVAYRLWDESKEKVHGSSLPILSALQDGRIEVLHQCLFNSFEAVIYPAFPELETIYRRFSSISPTKPLLSGSGSNLFSLHRTEAEAEEVCAGLQGEGYQAGVYHLIL